MAPLRGAGGFKLINDRAIKTLKDKLIKKVHLITPNIPEAEVLTKTKINSLEDMIYAANILLESGVRNILIKYTNFILFLLHLVMIFAKI